MSFPAESDTDVVVLRNIGGQTLDLTGWTVTDSDASTDSSGESTVYEFGEGEGCEDYASIAPSQKITLTPKTEENPCGFEFTVGIRYANTANICSMGLGCCREHLSHCVFLL